VASLLDEAERALAAGQAAEAERLFAGVLELDPDNARGAAGRKRAATTVRGLKRTFVPDLASAEGAEGRVKEIEGFDDVEDFDVRRAVRIPGRAEIEGAPAPIKPGDTYTVKIHLRNQSKKKKRVIKIAALDVRRVVNGVLVAVPLTPAAAAVAPKQRVLLATLTGPWEDDVTAWQLVVRVLAEGGDVYENRLVWK
jgi:hypothetical protein